MSLAEALAAAGGVNARDATSRGIYVIRNTAPDKIDIYQLNAKNAMALAMADRFEMNPRDIVYVDASGLATWNRLLGLITPTLTAIQSTTNTVYYMSQISRNGWSNPTTTTTSGSSSKQASTSTATTTTTSK